MNPADMLPASAEAIAEAAALVPAEWGARRDEPPQLGAPDCQWTKAFEVLHWQRQFPIMVELLRAHIAGRSVRGWALRIYAPTLSHQLTVWGEA